MGGIRGLRVVSGLSEVSIVVYLFVTMFLASSMSPKVVTRVMARVGRITVVDPYFGVFRVPIYATVLSPFVVPLLALITSVVLVRGELVKRILIT